MVVDGLIWGELASDSSFPIHFDPANSAGFLVSDTRKGYETKLNGGLDVFSNLTSYYVDSWVSVFYNRVIFNPMAIDAGNVTTDLEYDVIVSPCYEHFESLTLNQIESKSSSITLEGKQSGKIASWSLVQYRVHISATGESDINSNLIWQFNELASDAAILPISGTRSFIFDYHGQNVTETFEFLTDISRTFTDEQRLSLRAISRQKYSYEFLLFGDKQTDFTARLEGLYALKWVFPLWHEGVISSLPVAKGDIEIQCDTTESTLSESKQLIIVTSSNEVLSLQIASVSTGKVTLNSTVDKDLGVVTIYPARNGVSLSGIKSTVESSHTSVSVEWTIDNPVRVISTPKLTCHGIEVLNRKTAKSKRIGKMTYDTFDSKINSPDRYPNRQTPDGYYSINLRSIKRSETFETRKLLDRLEGSYGLIYLPTWDHELSIYSSYKAGSTTLSVSWKDGEKYFQAIDSLYLECAGQAQAIEVTNVEKSGDNFVLTLTKPLVYDITPELMTVFCRLIRVRGANDNVSIGHGSNGMSTCTLNFIEA